VRDRFQLGAKVEFKLMRVPLSKKKGEIDNVEYDLSG